ncbi:hypothetical protein ES703_71665 [subsurface metagenome]
MRVDDLPLRSVDHGIRNETGPPTCQRPDHQHCRSRPQVTLTRPNQSVVVQLVKTQAWVSMDMAAVESAQTIDRNRVGSVLPHHRLHAQVHRRRRL